MREYFIWLAKLVTLGVVVIIAITMLIGAGVAAVATSKVAQLEEHEGDRIGVVELDGIIMESKEVVRELYKQAKDHSIVGIVLRVNSPGGSVGPSQDIYQAIREIKKIKPVVASMESVAASGGLYASVAATKVYAQPGTLTGSIGVIVQFPNVAKIADKYDFQMITVKSGKNKDAGNAFRAFTEDDRVLLQDTVDSVQKQFVGAVAEGRNMKVETVAAFADGRVLTGAKAKELGLVDEFGTIYDAARAAHELAGKPLPADEAPELYYPKDDKFEKFAKFLEGVIDLPMRSEAILRGQGIELLYLM